MPAHLMVTVTVHPDAFTETVELLEASGRLRARYGWHRDRGDTSGSPQAIWLMATVRFTTPERRVCLRVVTPDLPLVPGGPGGVASRVTLLARSRA